VVVVFINMAWLPLGRRRRAAPAARRTTRRAWLGAAQFTSVN